MTEPDGCGSDPSLTYTTATRVDGGWRITGRKWFTTGAGVSSHFILIARTSDDERKGLTAFLFHRNAPGWELHPAHPDHGARRTRRTRRVDLRRALRPRRRRAHERRGRPQGDADSSGPGAAHALHALAGARAARVRIAAARVAERKAFGQLLAEHESVQNMLGAGRSRHRDRAAAGDARRLEAGPRRTGARRDLHGENPRRETLHDAADTALQLLGARGYSKDTIVEWIYRYARQARLVDGPSEVHRMVIAREFLAQRSRLLVLGDGGMNAQEQRAALARFIGEHSGGAAVDVDAIERLSGGAIQTNSRWSRGSTASRSGWWCAPSSASDDRASRSRREEFGLLQAAFASQVPVPEPLWWCDDARFLASRFS